MLNFWPCVWDVLETGSLVEVRRALRGRAYSGGLPCAH
jgi:hypothetical protein